MLHILIMFPITEKIKPIIIIIIMILGSVIGEPTSRSHNFSFSEPCQNEMEVEAGETEQAGVQYKFSEPLDTSQVSEKDPEDDQKIAEEPEVAQESSQHTKAEVEPSKDEEVDEAESTNAPEDESDESSEDEEANPGGLNFSWTAIPATGDVNVSQLVNEEISSLTFAAPIVEAEDAVEDLNDSQFEFGEPNDESMTMDVVDNVDEKEEIVPEELNVPNEEDNKLETAASEITNLFENKSPVKRSSRTIGNDTLDISNVNSKIAKEESEPFQSTTLVKEDSSHLETPKLKGRSTRKSQNMEDKEDENILQVASSADTEVTPETQPMSTTPLRRSSRKSSKTMEDILTRAETLPLEKTPSKRTPRKPSMVVPPPVLDEETALLETIVEEKSLEDKSLSRISTDPMSSITTPEASKSTSTRRKGKKDTADVTPTTELNPDESISKSKRSSKTKVEEKVEGEAVIEKVPKDSKTPATPIRSGADICSSSG